MGETMALADKICDVFKAFDTDGSKTITLTEIKNLLYKLDRESWSEENCENLLRAVDENHNGTIEIYELINYVCDDKISLADKAFLTSDTITDFAEKKRKAATPFPTF